MCSKYTLQLMLDRFFSLIKFLVIPKPIRQHYYIFHQHFQQLLRRLPFLEDFNVFSSGKQRNGNRSSIIVAFFPQNCISFFYILGKQYLFPAKLLTHVVVVAAIFKKPTRNVNKKSLKIKEQMTRRHIAHSGAYISERSAGGSKNFGNSSDKKKDLYSLGAFCLSPCEND